MKVLGLISGTSHDGIDCAVAEFWVEQDVLHATIDSVATVSYSEPLRAQLMAALPPAEVGVGQVTALDTWIGQEFAEAAAEMAAGGDIDLICSHGQTVFHWVENSTARGSLQLGNPAWIAERTGIPVLSDLRSRDIAASGQGAPLVPVLDALLLAAEDERSAALNLGGISNVTLVEPYQAPVAYDIGPANALIDAAVRFSDAHPAGYDQDGQLAAAGTVHHTLLEDLLAEPYYAAPAPKSTGKELFNRAYVEAALARTGLSLSAADLVATLTELTVRTVTDQLSSMAAKTVVVSGGGAANPVMMAGISRGLAGVRLSGSERYGVPSASKEALAFALIGWLSWHGLPGSLSSTTGAHTARILGTFTPGEHPLQLPPPLPHMPASLKVEAS